MKLVIFDCDGTLVDSELLCNLALEHQLAEIGVACNAQELLVKYRGGKLATIMASLEADFSISLPISFEKEYRAKVNTLFDEQLQPNAGVKEVLESLSMPFCITSSAPKDKIKRALSVTGLSEHFSKIYLALMKSARGSLSLNFSYMQQGKWGSCLKTVA